MTRRDQLGIKRAPPSQRKKGRGRGRGKGPKAGKGAAPKPKAKAKAKAKSKSKKAPVPQHDVEDEECSEAYDDEIGVKEHEPKKPRKGMSPKPKGILKAASASASKKPGLKSVGEDSKPRKRKSKADVVPADENVSKPPSQKRKVAKTTRASSTSPSFPQENVVGDSRGQIVKFLSKIDPDLELDGFKENVRRVVGDMGRASLNSYWTKFSCGLRWRTGRSVRDIAYFSFIRGNPGSKELKRVISIGCAVELVTRAHIFVLPCFSH